MARTRQKAKQRKAKRLEQERKVAERSAEPQGGLSESRQAAAEIEEAQERAALELAEAQQDEVGAGAEAARSAAAAEAATAAEVATTEKAKPAKLAKPAKTAKPKPAKQAQRAERKREPRQRGRVFSFFVQVWAELRRVQWPDRNQVTQATAVVVVFCALAGTYLGIWDFVFNKLAKALL
jgi:preprotein translocase subunit SecE